MNDRVQYSRLPPRVEHEMLDGGPGIYAYRDKHFEVFKKGGKLGVREADGIDARPASTRPAQYNVGLAVIGIGGFTGTTALMSAVGATTVSTHYSMLLVSAAAWAATGVGFLLTRK